MRHCPGARESGTGAVAVFSPAVNPCTAMSHATQLDTLLDAQRATWLAAMFDAPRDGTDAPSGPGTIVYRTWAQAEQVDIELLWRTFADAIDARRARLEGCSMHGKGKHQRPNGLLVRLETAGAADPQQRLIPLARLLCVRLKGGDMLFGNDPAGLDHGLLSGAARRWLHSTASDTTVLRRHAAAFDDLAVELGVDDAARLAAIEGAVESAKRPDNARTRAQAVG